jgi:phage host-nuclease inhibitor protein Gam
MWKEKMKQNNKSVILAVLIIAAVSIWIPKDGKPVATSADTLEQEIPVITAVSQKRTEYVDWGRNPFTFSQEEGKTGTTSDLVLRAIIWKAKKPSASINNSIVDVGDKINDKMVKQINEKNVILTDGKNNYVLELSK